MRPFENLTFMQLIDTLAVTTEKYTKVLKENRNSDEHAIFRNEIQELIAEIDIRRREGESSPSNPGLPGVTFFYE
jgi:hypothetical protein